MRTRTEPGSLSGGTYTLLIQLPTPATPRFGALGEHRLPSGWYAYTGSALGPGGFAQVDRHYEVASGRRETRHWHVDYLLGNPGTDIRCDVRSNGVDVESKIARSLPDSPVAGFGATDCDCQSHLAHARNGDELQSTVTALHRRLGDD